MNNLGLLLIVMGVLFMVGMRVFPALGHLPGDLVFQGKNGTVYVPFTTGLVLGLVASILLRLFCRS